MRATSHVHNRLLPGTPTPSSPTNISFYDSRKHASHVLSPSPHMNMSHLHSGLKCTAKLLPRLKIRDVLYCVLREGERWSSINSLLGNARNNKKPWEQITRLFAFWYFNKYGEADKILKLIIISYSDPFLSIVSTSTDARSIKFGRHNLRASHRRHVCSC
jgi:hypothetical protein